MVRSNVSLNHHASNTEVKSRVDFITKLWSFLWLQRQDQNLEGEVKDWAHRCYRSSARSDIRGHCHGHPDRFWWTSVWDLNSILYFTGNISYLNSTVYFISDIPHYYLYNLFYYLSETYNDSSWFGGLCLPRPHLHNRVCDPGRGEWREGHLEHVSAILSLYPGSATDSRLWLPAGHVTSLAQFLPGWRPCVCVFVGGGGWWTRRTSRPLCLFSSLK